MYHILRRVNPFFDHARVPNVRKRRNREQRPCVMPLEARTLMASFQGLGTSTNATAVSADGTVVVGHVNGTVGGPFYWTQSAGRVLLRDSSGNIYQGQATSVSGDGSFIVGGDAGAGGLGNHQAWRWTGGVVAPIPQLASLASSANSVSADGTIIAGDVQKNYEWGPFVLTGATLETIPPPTGLYWVPGTTMSANGAVVAVNTFGGTDRSYAYQWESGTLIKLPGSAQLNSFAMAVSPDGSVVVGVMHVAFSSDPPVLFEWTNGVVTALTPPADYQVWDINNSAATGVSNDGSIIVGKMIKSNSFDKVAFIWDQTNGVRDLQQVLTADGLGSSLSGWALTDATAITPDGNTIVGNGIDPQGQQEGWIVSLSSSIPPPTLRSITVTPASPSMTVGTTRQLTASGLFSDDSTENITTQVTWASATPSVATISSTGLATAVTTGTSYITASLSGVTGAATLTVTPAPILQSITVAPPSSTITVGTAQQFVAIGHFSDSSIEDLTSQVTWASATPSVAAISSTGLAQAVAIGTTTIRASLNGVIGESTMSVLHQTRISLTVTPRRLTFGQYVTLTASVSIVGARGSPATGTVTFSDGYGSLGTFLLRRGKYTLRTKALPVGQYSIQVSYNGSSTFLPSGPASNLVTVRLPKPRGKRG
jgi:uncharacterized membrane protein